MGDEKQQTNIDIRDYIRVLSHQLKSPINAIESLLKTILEGYAGNLDEQTVYILKKAVQRSGDARTMISDLLDFEMYAEKNYGEDSEIDVGKLCNGLANRFSMTASDKNISFRADLPRNTDIYVRGDEKGLEHALRNLLENAFKYTPEQGSVVFTVSTDTNRGVCVFEVTDTGSGMPEDELGNIFEPFFRSSIHRSGMAGTGLGLPIVKRVVDRFGGRIDVQSKEGMGSTFKIELAYKRLENRTAEDEPGIKVVIIGGVTAGPKTAARLRRLDERADITIVEKGGALSYSGCGLPRYLSGKLGSPKELMISGDCTVHDIDFFETIENVRVLNNTLATSIDRKNKVIEIKNLQTRRITYLSYDILVLATGALPSVPKIPGIGKKHVFTLRSLEDAEAIKGELGAGRARDIYIIGGGLIGVSAAEEIQDAGGRITIIEKKDHILNKLFDRDMALRLQSELNGKGIKILKSTEVTKISAPGGKTGSSLSIHTESGIYQADLIIMSAGVTPNTDLARNAGLDIGESGGIIVDDRLRTSDEHIYAVGDCAESVHITTGEHEYWPLGSVSTKMGRIAADNIFGGDVDFTGSLGTAMFKARDFNVARTGLTLRAAAEKGFNAVCAVVTGKDNTRAADEDYIVLKIIADRESAVLLGAQGFGKGNVAGKIAIAAMAASRGLTLMDVFKLDLGYAPDYNSPVELTQTACLTLQNKIDGLVSFISPDELAAANGDFRLVSVCPANIHAQNLMPGAVNIPLARLRSEGLPFDHSENIVLYSRTSLAAYKAYRYLLYHGYTSLRVLEGGYLFWRR